MDRTPNDAPFNFSFVPSPNPFAPVAAAGSTLVDAVWSQDTEYTDEEDVPRPEAIDVRILWGTNVLHFAQLSPPCPFTLGGAGSDFTLPDGEAQAACPLVTLRDGVARVLVPAGATADVRLVNGQTLSLLQCVQNSFAERSGIAEGAYEILLAHGATATVRLPGSELVFEVSRVRAGRKLDAGFWSGADLSGHLYTGMSALAHATLLGALAFFLPTMQVDDAESVDRNSAAAMRPYLAAIAEKEPEHKEAVAELEAAAANGGGQGSQASGPSGAAGDPVSTATHPARFAIHGESRDPKIVRERMLVDASHFGVVGILNTDAATNTPSSVWGAERAEGRDAKNALTSMWAQSIDDAWGPGGIGLGGTEQGGGGLAHGVGIDGIEDTVGHGTGAPDGDGPSKGPGHAFGPRGVGHPRGGLVDYQPHGPSLHPSPITTFSGSLPKELVQRVVRQNFGRFRLCYEAGLRGNPALTGRVAVAFVIDRSGNVAVASADGSTDMADANVVSCVVRGFQNLSFPAPKDGTVQVIYPLLLAPGE
jgi:hypothetical protein